MSKPVIAIDIGGTRIKMGIIKDNILLSSASIDAYSGNGLMPRLPYIQKTVEDLLKKEGLYLTDIAGLGIASPGIVDHRGKRILSIDKKFGDAPDINLEEWSRQTFGLPFFLENDARAALIGEWKYGKAKEYDNAVLMTLGTGVGSAAVMEGHLLRGKHFTAGILGGHSIINYKGGLCNCGNKGCVETEASTWSLPSISKANQQFSEAEIPSLSDINYQVIFSLAAEGNLSAIRIRDQSLDAWSACAINLIHAYDPEILVLSGGIMASSSSIIPYIRQQTDTYAWTHWGKVKIEAASFPATAALSGMAYLINNQ